jgi:hypothetical protein
MDPQEHRRLADENAARKAELRDVMPVWAEADSAEVDLVWSMDKEVTEALQNSDSYETEVKVYSLTSSDKGPRDSDARDSGVYGPRLRAAQTEASNLSARGFKVEVEERTTEAGRLVNPYAGSPLTGRVEPQIEYKHDIILHVSSRELE